MRARETTILPHPHQTRNQPEKQRGGRTSPRYTRYDLVRIHRTFRVSPATQAGLTNRVWSVEDIIGLLERAEEEPAA